jgi:hypothetical protein
MPIFSNEDLAFYKDNDGKMHAGGFKLNTIFNNNNMPMMSITSQMGGAKSKNNILDSLTDGLAVPAGLFYLNTTPSSQTISSTNNEVASNHLIDRLVDLMDPIDEKTRKMTRKKAQKHSKQKHSKQKHSKQKQPAVNRESKYTAQTKKSREFASKNTTRKVTH